MVFDLELVSLAFPVQWSGIFDQIFLGGLGAFGLFRDSMNVSFIVAFETWLNVILYNGFGTPTMLWAETIGWRFNRVPRYHDLGGRSEKDASLATHGTNVLVRVGRQGNGI